MRWHRAGGPRVKRGGPAHNKRLAPARLLAEPLRRTRGGRVGAGEVLVVSKVIAR